MRGVFPLQTAQTALDLDQQGYDEVVDLVRSITDRAKEIQEQSAARLATASSGDRKTHATALMVMHVVTAVIAVTAYRTAMPAG